MTLEDDVRAILAAPAETTTLDLKEAIGWTSLHNQIEIAKDVVCLANRQGGQLLYGVKDLGKGRWQAVGLAAGDDIPDSTDLAKTVRKYFDPVPPASTYEVVVDGVRYGLIRVTEFERIPSICKAIGNDEKGQAVVRPGYIYRRSDLLECAAVETAGGIQAIVESAAAKTGAIIRGMLGERTEETETRLRAITATEGSFRFCDLLPEPTPAREGLAALTDRISESSVRTSGGGVGVPRSIDPSRLQPSAIVRDHDSVLVERSREDESGRGSSLIEVTRTLKVRIREELWEDEGVVDYSSLFAFVFGSLKFAALFYRGTTVESVDVHVGLSGVLGRRLADNPARFSGFYQTYVATTAADLAASKKVDVAELAAYENRIRISRELIVELGEYFGFRLNADAFDAHVKYIEEWMDVKGDIATGNAS